MHRKVEGPSISTVICSRGDDKVWQVGTHLKDVILAKLSHRSESMSVGTSVKSAQSDGIAKSFHELASPGFPLRGVLELLDHDVADRT